MKKFISAFLLTYFYLSNCVIIAAPDGVTVEMKIIDTPMLLRQHTIAYTIRNNTELNYSFSEHWLMNPNIYIQVKNNDGEIVVNDVGGYFEDKENMITLSPGTSIIILGLPPENRLFKSLSHEKFTITHSKFSATFSHVPAP